MISKIKRPQFIYAWNYAGGIFKEITNDKMTDNSAIICAFLQHLAYLHLKDTVLNIPNYNKVMIKLSKLVFKKTALNCFDTIVKQLPKQ